MLTLSFQSVSRRSSDNSKICTKLKIASIFTFINSQMPRRPMDYGCDSSWTPAVTSQMQNTKKPNAQMSQQQLSASRGLAECRVPSAGQQRGAAQAFEPKLITTMRIMCFFYFSPHLYEQQTMTRDPNQTISQLCAPFTSHRSAS